MEEMALSGVQVLTSYGALGGIAVYFVYKDFVLNKQLTDALQKFTLALNLMCNGKVD